MEANFLTGSGLKAALEMHNVSLQNHKAPGSYSDDTYQKTPVEIQWLSDDATLLIKEANKIQNLNSLGSRVSVVQSNAATRL